MDGIDDIFISKHLLDKLNDLALFNLLIHLYNGYEEELNESIIFNLSGDKENQSIIVYSSSGSIIERNNFEVKVPSNITIVIKKEQGLILVKEIDF